MQVIFLRERYFEPTSILDIGASTGVFHKMCKETYPDAYYFLIEGSPSCEAHLQGLNVDYFIGVMSDTNRNAVYYINKSDVTSTGNSLYREKSHYYRDDNIIEWECQTHTLESILSGKTFDFIKMDVQGSELDIMRGGLDIIKRAKGILLELAVVPFNDGAPLQDEVIQFMNSINFQEAEEVDVARDPSSGQITHRDVFFINKGL